MLKSKCGEPKKEYLEIAFKTEAIKQITRKRLLKNKIFVLFGSVDECIILHQ
jgi:hypothetical protein